MKDEKHEKRIADLKELKEERDQLADELEIAKELLEGVRKALDGDDGEQS